MKQKKNEKKLYYAYKGGEYIKVPSYYYWLIPLIASIIAGIVLFTILGGIDWIFEYYGIKF